MKPSAFAYHGPRSSDDLMALLARLDNAKLLAGGQSLMPMLNLRLVAPDHLIDINRIPELVSGRPLTTTYGDYLLPAASEMPDIDIHHIETPSPRNPIGVKGAGEGGTIPAAACVISAIEDALGPNAPPITMHPVSPEDILEWLKTIKA